jgi:AraC-like DNA-binding protein/quercetin dioxygenase-like cupin family protein
MKIMYEQIDFPGRSAVKVKWQVKPHFTYPWHFHNEYELLYIIDGFGTSFVADNIEHFESGDLVLLGSNLPHFWRSDELYSKEKLNVKYIVVQFPEDFFRDQINHYPEFQRIGDLLKRSSRGIRFFPEFVKTISHKITELIRTEDLERILALLHLLQTLAKTSEYRLLAGELYQEMPQDLNSDRLTRILHYINTNYQRKIELDKVAEIASLHPSAFCRFFREKTGKTFSEYVTDMRISYACKLIIERKIMVSQVCFESGFNNLSNFNRLFKKQTGFSPTEYYQQFHKKQVPG